MAYLRHFTDPDDMLDFTLFTRPCVASYEKNGVTIPIYNNITNLSLKGEHTRIVKVGDDYSFANDLVVTSNMTISKRSVFNTITVRNNAVLTIDAFVLVVDIITVEAGSQIRVSPTSVLVAGDGGIVTADVNGLYIEADVNGNGAVVFNETVLNNHPLATVAVYNYSYEAIPNLQYIWEWIGNPIYRVVKVNNGINKNYPCSAKDWDKQNGWLSVSLSSIGMDPNKGYNLTRLAPAPGLDWEFYGELQGNNNVVFSFNLAGYYALALSYSAAVSMNYMLTILSEISALDNSVSICFRTDDSETVLPITSSNVNIYPEIPMMLGFMLLMSNASSVTLTINYNDAVLAYYKQKYNF